MSENPLSIIPLNFGVKFNPPKLGLEYHMPQQPQVKLIYEIALQPLLEQHLGTEDIVAYIFNEHKQFVHPRVVPKEQIRRLIERVRARQQTLQNKNKENSNKQNMKLALSSGVDLKEQKPSYEAGGGSSQIVQASNQLPDSSSAQQKRMGAHPHRDDLILHDQHVTDNIGDSVDQLQDEASEMDSQMLEQSSDMAQAEQFLAGNFNKQLFQNNNAADSAADLPDSDYDLNQRLDDAEDDEDVEGEFYGQELPVDEDAVEMMMQDHSQSQLMLDDAEDQDDQFNQQQEDSQDQGLESDDGDAPQEDVIDIDNPEDLARRGLSRVQLEGDETEYLLDQEGNIYNLQGEFVGTANDGDTSMTADQ